MCALPGKRGAAQGYLGEHLGCGYHTLSLALLHEISLLGYKIKSCSESTQVHFKAEKCKHYPVFKYFSYGDILGLLPTSIQIT